MTMRIMNEMLTKSTLVLEKLRSVESGGLLIVPRMYEHWRICNEIKN
jgi:hypothetical protein